MRWLIHWVAIVTRSYFCFSGGSDGKESACSAGDLGSIPGLGRSPGEGNGNPFQYICLENPMDCSPPASSVHEILLVRILEWVAIPFSRGSSQPRDRAQVSCIVGRCCTVWDTREAQRVCAYIYIYGLHVYSVISRHFCCFHFLAI